MRRKKSSADGNPRGWRQNWKRAPAGRRTAAAAALSDLFERPRSGRVLPLVLLGSLVLHAATAPLLALVGVGLPRRDLSSSEDAYLRQVMQKQRAKEISKEVKDRMTMPPPPPDPEAVVSSTLTSEITTDIERVIGKMMGVDVTDKLASRVAASLRDELAEAAKNIAEGRLSEQEIKELQETFKRKAHERTVEALQEHREETQVERAKMSVTEWYENRVSRILTLKMRYEVFGRQYGRGRVWQQYWNWHLGWGFLHSRSFLDKVGRVRGLSNAQHYDPRGTIGGVPLEHGQRRLPDWPRPTAKSAAALLTVLRSIFDRHPKGWQPSWDGAVDAYVSGFLPHRRAAIAEQFRKINSLWSQAFRHAELFRQKAQAGAPATDRLAARTACLQTLKELYVEAGKLWVGHERAGQYTAVNQAVRSRVLRGPGREKICGRFVDSLVKALGPAVRDLAENEFREGIIIREKGIDQTTETFIEQIVGLLRRDIKAVLPKPRFDRLVFDCWYPHSPYRSTITDKYGPPSGEDIARDEERYAKITAAWTGDDRAYPGKRAELITREFHQAAERVVAELTSRLLTDGRFDSRFYASVESVDYTDRVQQRLDARKRALAGRGQDLAQLTDDGVPDPSASVVALMFGASKGHGASLEPVATTMSPSHIPASQPARVLRPCGPRYPPPPKKWGRMTQAEVTPRFKTPRCEGIPFLANFPKLDGDLRDWGRIRPLVTRRIGGQGGPSEEILIYAAWNYQGYFFGYHVTQPDYRFSFPQSGPGRPGLVLRRPSGYHWAYKGEYLRLLLDTLDARAANRGHPHTQEFVIFPRGTEYNPDIPGIERIIHTERDMLRRGQDHSIKAETKIFPPQPEPHAGPDGTGPYRVTRFAKDGYTTEIFLPRTLFTVPVFCPGWYVGFEAIVGVGAQPRYNCAIHGRIWANPRWHGHGDLGDKDHPRDWGDLLLLGTDPYLAVQDIDGARTKAVIPGHSYLITVMDPDRNVNLAAEDIVLVSAEVMGGSSPESNDVEVFILKETGKNKSVFRGYINTQPGSGRQVQGAVELTAGQELRLGYLDLANAEGRRNVVYSLRLPVIAAVTEVATKAR